MAAVFKVKVAEAELDLWAIPDEFIRGGNPIAKGRFLWQSDDRRLGNGVWTCEPGSFSWDYTWDETIYFIEGEVIIRVEDGNSNTYKAGDLIFVPSGTRTEWQVLSPVRKVFYLRSDIPVEL